jgi:ribosomal protein L9
MPNTARGTRGRGRAAQKPGSSDQTSFRPAPKPAAPKAAAPKAKPATQPAAKPADSKPSKYTDAQKKAYQEAQKKAQEERKSKTVVVAKDKTVTNSADVGKDHARISHQRVHHGLKHMDASCLHQSPGHTGNSFWNVHDPWMRLFGAPRGLRVEITTAELPTRTPHRELEETPRQLRDAP